MVREALDLGKKHMYHQHNGIWLYREAVEKAKTGDNTSVWRHFMGQEIKQLVQLLETFPNPNSIVGVKTDCVFYQDEDFTIEGSEEIGGYHNEVKRPKMFTRGDYPTFTMSDFKASRARVPSTRGVQAVVRHSCCWMNTRS
eukprot:m.218948 g.218948  ORF g.218948 m.218948 type:complete len:141 (+) comp17226_c0_seq8:1076-1498(+)